MVSAHGPGTGGAHWARVALRAGDPAGRVHLIDRELPPAGAFVFLPRRERRVHLGVHDSGGGVAARIENRLAAANHEGCDVAAIGRNLCGLRCRVRGDKVPHGGPLDSRAGISVGDDELVDRRCSGDRINRAVFPDLCRAAAAAVHGLLEKKRESARSSAQSGQARIARSAQLNRGCSRRELWPCYGRR